MQFDNQKTRNVADVAARIMAGETVSEELKGNQHKIDKNKNNKIDAEDFKMLRKEESDVVEEGKLTQKAQKVVSTVGDVAGATGTVAGGVLGGTAKTAGAVRQLAPATKDAYNRGRAATQKAVAEEFEEVCEKCGCNPCQCPVEEEAEQIDEVKMADLPSRKVQGKSYGASKPKTNPFDVLKGPKSKDLDAIKKDEKKMVPDWARGPNESVNTFSAMLESYKQDGLKSLAKMNKLKEEPDNEQFTKEVEEVKKKASEKKSPEDEARVAKGKVDAVKVEEEIEQIDEVGDTPAGRKVLSSYVNKALGDKNREKGLRKATSRLYKDNYYGKKNEEVEEIDEREMTDAEMKKREEIVKSMKKGMQGFKDRYGDRAKSVMYATATKIAKEKA